MQVTEFDDTFESGSVNFSNFETDKSVKFECNFRDEFFPMKCNGFWINTHEPG